MRYFSILFLFMFFGNAQETIIDKANALIGQKKYKTAQTLLEEQLKISSVPILKDKLGEVYSYQMNWDAAIDIYEELTDIEPNSADYQYKHGGVLGKKALSSSKFTALMIVGDMKKAFLNAAKLDPNHIGARWALVDVFISLPGVIGGSKSKALAYAKELKKVSAIDGCFALGYVYEYDDKPKEAKQSYLDAFKLIENHTNVKSNQLHYQIGKVSCDYGMELDSGIFHMQEYINNFSVKDGVPLFWAYFRMAKMYRQKGDKQKANSWIQKALTTKPDFKLALEEKAIIDVL